MSNNNYTLSSAPLLRALLHLCLPMIAGLAAGSLYNVAGAAIVGHLDNTAFLAALTFGLPVYSLIMGFGNLFGVGGGTYMSRLAGEYEKSGDSHLLTRIKNVSAFTLWASLSVGVVLGIVVALCAHPIAHAIGAGSGTPTAAATSTFIVALALGSPLHISAFSLEQLVRAEGAASHSMIGMGIGAAANVLFDLIFILGLGWGMTGAGVALALTNLIVCAYYVWWLSTRSSQASLRLSDVHVDTKLVTTVVETGSSELFMTAFIIITTLIMNWIAMSYSEALLASMGLALRVSNLVEMIVTGIVMGSLPLMSYAFGAGKHQRLHAAIRSVALANLAVVAIFSTAIFVFKEPFLHLFSSDAEVIADSTSFLTAMLVSTAFNGLTSLMISVFQATEQGRAAAALSIIQGVAFVPIVLAAHAWIGMTGVIWSMTAAEFITFLAAAAIYVHNRRRLDAAPSKREAPEMAEALAA